MVVALASFISVSNLPLFLFVRVDVYSLFSSENICRSIRSGDKEIVPKPVASLCYPILDQNLGTIISPLGNDP